MTLRSHVQNGKSFILLHANRDIGRQLFNSFGGTTWKIIVWLKLLVASVAIAVVLGHLSGDLRQMVYFRGAESQVCQWMLIGSLIVITAMTLVPVLALVWHQATGPNPAARTTVDHLTGISTRQQIFLRMNGLTCANQSFWMGSETGAPPASAAPKHPSPIHARHSATACRHVRGEVARLSEYEKRHGAVVASSIVAVLREREALLPTVP